MLVWSLGHEDPMEDDVKINSGILAWKTHGHRSLMGTVHRIRKSMTCLKLLSKHIYLKVMIPSLKTAALNGGLSESR